MDKLKYVAKRLNMLPYRSEAKKEIVEFAKENGIVIVYGASDDLMELDGAIYDEFGCYEGGVCCLDSEGNILEEMTNNCRTIEAKNSLGRIRRIFRTKPMRFTMIPSRIVRVLCFTRKTS